METYVPRLDQTAAALAATALSDATAALRTRGAAIELLHSFAILREETCFSLFSAATSPMCIRQQSSPKLATTTSRRSAGAASDDRWESG